MNTEFKNIVVMRVANGWLIRRESEPGYITETAQMLVARTPGELAQIITDWATAQERK